MKKLTETEIKNKIIKYLNSKGIEMTLTSGGDMIWKYEPHYSKFTVKLYFRRKNYYGEDLVISYYSNLSINGIRKRKTSIRDGFCLKIYRNLLWIKENLDKHAQIIKAKKDINIRYCTELEMHYKKRYEAVEITSEKDEDSVDITINCYNKKGDSCYYLMTYKDNKYYLNYKAEELNRIIPLI